MAIPCSVAVKESWQQFFTLKEKIDEFIEMKKINCKYSATRLTSLQRICLFERDGDDT